MRFSKVSIKYSFPCHHGHRKSGNRVLKKSRSSTAEGVYATRRCQEGRLWKGFEPGDELRFSNADVGRGGIQ